MKLIDKDALVAEVKRRKELVSDPILSGNDLMIGERNAYFNLLPFIDSLEVKEVDLEKEIGNFFGDDDWKASAFEEEQRDMIKFARHFFELGLKARQ